MSTRYSPVLEVACWTCLAKPGERCKTTTTGRVTDTHAMRYETRYPPAGAHTCTTLDPGCYRCDLNRDEMGVRE
jgi:hypothetical protein